MLKLFVISQTPKNYTGRLYDIRIAIGIGNESEIVENNGEAYVLSGHLLDDMNEKRIDSYDFINIKTPWEDINEQLDIYLKTLEMIISKWTVAQTKVAFYTLSKVKRADVVKNSGITSPGVTKALRIIHLDFVERIIKNAEYIISEKLKKEQPCNS